MSDAEAVIADPLALDNQCINLRAVSRKHTHIERRCSPIIWVILLAEVRGQEKRCGMGTG